MGVINDIDLTPITRLEYDIDAILNDHAVAEPITRIELILADIVAGNATTVVPVTRIETFLANISGVDIALPEPVTRIETFLAIIAGGDYEAPEPATRLEGLLAEWVEKGSGIWKTVTGTLIHITDALASPVKELSIAIEPQQSGSGDPSPDNVRPITGWTGANAYVTGVNVWDEEWEQGTINVSNGDNEFNGARWRSKNYIPIKPNTQYCYRWGADGNKTTGRVAYYDQNKNFISGSASFPSGVSAFANPYVFTTPSNAYYMRFSPASGNTYGNDTSINYPSTDTSYHAYSGTTASVTFPDSVGTVYGGTVDLVSGVLTVDRKLAVLTHTMAWEKGATNTEASVFFLSDAVVSDKSPVSWDSVETIANWAIKSTAKSTEAAHMVSGRYYWTTADGYWRVGYGTPDTTVDEFKAFLQTNPLQVVCPITTPINYQLTPKEISTLAGENNVWGSGNIELTYKAQAE